MSSPLNPLDVTRPLTPLQEQLLEERLDNLRVATETFAAPAPLEAKHICLQRASHQISRE